MECTKGGWTIKPIGGGITPLIYEITDNSGTFIGRVKTLANARLIAASPRMIEFIQKLANEGNKEAEDFLQTLDLS